MTSNSVLRRTETIAGDDEAYVDERPSRRAARRVRTAPSRSQSQRNTAAAGESGHDGRLRARPSSSQRSPGHSRGTISSSGWKLRYRDFVPSNAVPGTSKTVETFQKLVDRANEWLQMNVGVCQVMTCETVTWCAVNPQSLGDSEQMALSTSIERGSKTFYLRGLRLWLVPATTKRQKIAFIDVVPDSNDRVQHLVNRANKTVERRRITGRLLTAETVSVPAMSDGHVIPGLTRWTEMADVDRSYAFVLRIFYDSKDLSAGHLYGANRVTIEIKDLAPSVDSTGNYEGFETLVDRANQWLKEQRNVSILNMQSLVVQEMRQEDHAETGGPPCHYTVGGINSKEVIEFFRILRLAVIRLPASTPSSAHANRLLPVVYRSFAPQLLPAAVEGNEATTGRGSTRRRRRPESMKETFARVIVELINTDEKVVCAETVMNPLQMYMTDESLNTADDQDQLRFLLTLRLFVTSGKNARCSSALVSESGGETSDKASVEGGRQPLFLGHVVTRRFKYRWLVLGVSAFTCMAIIVIVSVVYSNR